MVYLTKEDVTIWERFDVDKKIYRYNHYNEGKLKIDNPYRVARFDNQIKSWKKAQWKRVYGYKYTNDNRISIKEN